MLCLSYEMNPPATVESKACPKVRAVAVTEVERINLDMPTPSPEPTFYCRFRRLEMIEAML